MLLPRDALTLGRGCLWRGPDRGLLGDTGDTRLPSQGALRVCDNMVLLAEAARAMLGTGHRANLRASFPFLIGAPRLSERTLHTDCGQRTGG